ncbi:MAG: DNA ligase, partial [Marivirga sp.]|nr:DNA ligase [Marivirga sp.]
MSLDTYTRKRNFSKTPEPKGKVKSLSKKLGFVVQRHDASHLHYDFRLELDGVLKSWAVPKGPSLDPHDKRLAVMVEDHPISYGKFEGVIPEGNYGAGTVDIWDSGTYIPEVPSKDPAANIRKGLKAGSLKFIMKGRKLQGSFALVRLKDGKEKNWLLIKHRDEFARDSFNIESPAQKGKPASAKKDVVVRSVRSNKRKLSRYIKPMLATLGDKPFDHADWIYEIKWDGYRAIGEINKDVKFYSRNGLSFLELYPAIAQELSKIKGNVVLDGEVVVLDDKGKPSFQKLQQYGENHSLNLVYYVFDCLRYSGKSITEKTLLERKKILKKILRKGNLIRYSDHVEKDGVKFYSEIIKTGGLEGMIAKLASSTYRTGYRTTNWLKIKNHNTQEAIITGFTEPRASRKFFGAL